MSSGRHALRLMDRHGGVVTTLRKRLARVQAHPDPNGDPARPGMRRERTLRVPAGEHGLPRVGEGQEQAIPERLDHDPVPVGDRSSDQGVVLRDQGAKALTEVLVELGRRLDVGEAERRVPRAEGPCSVSSVLPSCLWEENAPVGPALEESLTRGTGYDAGIGGRRGARSSCATASKPSSGLRVRPRSPPAAPEPPRPAAIGRVRHFPRMAGASVAAARSAPPAPPRCRSAPRPGRRSTSPVAPTAPASAPAGSARHTRRLPSHRGQLSRTCSHNAMLWAGAAARPDSSGGHRRKKGRPSVRPALPNSR